MYDQSRVLQRLRLLLFLSTLWKGKKPSPFPNGNKRHMLRWPVVWWTRKRSGIAPNAATKSRFPWAPWGLQEHWHTWPQEEACWSWRPWRASFAWMCCPAHLAWWETLIPASSSWTPIPSLTLLGMPLTLEQEWLMGFHSGDSLDCGAGAAQAHRLLCCRKVPQLCSPGCSFSLETY